MTTRLATGVAVTIVLLSACGTTPAATGVTPPTRGADATRQLSLASAIRQARDLGEVAPGQRLTFNLTLAGRDPQGLQTQLASGRAISAADFKARFAPSPQTAARVRSVVAAESLTASWQPGDVLMSVSGTAAAAQRFLGVAVHNFAGADGRVFHAPLHPPVPPLGLSGQVLSVTGLDDFVSGRTAALLPGDTNGFTPKDATTFYDIQPLYDAHLDGSGQTVVFIDWSVPGDDTLAQYAQKFTPSRPFDVTVVQDPQHWGAPLTQSDQQWSDTAGETALDLETVHGIAPGAKEVVYAFSTASAIPDVIKAVAAKYPNAILSSSIGGSVLCETDEGAKDYAVAVDQVMSAAAAQGLSIFWASGDRGAFGCLPGYPDKHPDGNTNVSLAPDSASAGETAVGGTTVFMGTGGSYAQEAAWGEPSEQWGSGGGVSTLISRPAWQKAPGVPGDMKGRGVPDVSANADSLTGWDTFSPSSDNGGTVEAPVGGTSAAAPFWAALTALIDQDLSNKSLPPVGFANPALYTFAQSPAGLPAPAFHDITLGSNLHFPAGPGWDAATGLGTPDAAALTEDFEWFAKNHGASQ